MPVRTPWKSLIGSPTEPFARYHIQFADRSFMVAAAFLYHGQSLFDFTENFKIPQATTVSKDNSGPLVLRPRPPVHAAPVLGW